VAVSEASVTVEPDKFCCVCGADDETDPSVVSGFMAFPVVTPRSKLAMRRICDACLAMLLAVTFQRAGSGLVTMVARAATRAEGPAE
jgi:hypothetical protein